MTVAIVVYKGLIPVVGRILTDKEGHNLFFPGVKIVFPPMQYFRNVSLYIRMPVGV